MGGGVLPRKARRLEYPLQSYSGDDHKSMRPPPPPTVPPPPPPLPELVAPRLAARHPSHVLQKHTKAITM